LRFQVNVNRLDVRQVPRSWSLPTQIEGRLTGSADLQITLVNGKAVTSGTGRGVIREARVGNQPAEPIVLELHAAGDRYRFVSQRFLPPHDGANVVLAQPPATADQELPRDDGWFSVRTVAGLIDDAVREVDVLLEGSGRWLAPVFPAPAK